MAFVKKKFGDWKKMLNFAVAFGKRVDSRVAKWGRL